MFWNVRATPSWVIRWGLRPASRSAVEADISLDGLVDPGDDVERTGLARPVWSDQGEDLSPADAEIETGHGDHPAEAHGDAVKMKDGIGRRPGLPGNRSGHASPSADGGSRAAFMPPPPTSAISARRWREGSRPSGRKIIMMTNAAPKAEDP